MYWVAGLFGFPIQNVSVRADSGACHLQLHGRAAELLSAWAPAQIALSLSHDGNYAVAVVTALPSSSTFPDTQYDHRRH